MKDFLLVPIEKLVEEPYASIVCYPKSSETEVNRRLRELRDLKVEALEFCGAKEAFGVSVLGKGCVGLVVIAYVNGERVALKIRRVDADRTSMRREGEMLRMANTKCVGPKLFKMCRNFLLMEFVDGDLLPEWLDKHESKELVRKVLSDILEQCWRLDLADFDHGELSHAPKHIVVDEKDMPVILDFESASLNRKPANVTSICNFLFIGGLVAGKVAERLGVRDKDAVVEALRHYKNERTSGSFESVLKVCLF